MTDIIQAENCGLITSFSGIVNCDKNLTKVTKVNVVTKKCILLAKICSWPMHKSSFDRDYLTLFLKHGRKINRNKRPNHGLKI